jgi:hypothetical protein
MKNYGEELDAWLDKHYPEIKAGKAKILQEANDIIDKAWR